MWRWLADVAFPEQHSSVRGQVVDYYEFLYHQKPTNSQIDTIVRMDVNADSAHYDQFATT